jgi:hypothetical protein
VCQKGKEGLSSSRWLDGHVLKHHPAPAPKHGLREHGAETYWHASAIPVHCIRVSASQAGGHGVPWGERNSQALIQAPKMLDGGEELRRQLHSTLEKEITRGSDHATRCLNVRHR